MEEKEKNKKLIKILIILIAILTIITVALKVLNFKNQSNKSLSNYDYIIVKETEYSSNEKKGPMPIINLSGSDIDKINEEIIGKYYKVAYTADDIYSYEYTIYENILSLFIKITYVDASSEYGTIEYYAYNINLDDNKPLTNSELVNILGLKETNLNDEINSRIKKYYAIDTYNKEMSLDEYKTKINYREESNKYVIRDNILYCYTSLNTTQSLIEYKGNIEEIELTTLK